MPDSKALAEVKRRIEEVETALLSLDRAKYNPAIRARLIVELRRALEGYYLLVSGESRKSAATNFSN
jgi:hypothetical protein